MGINTVPIYIIINQYRNNTKKRVANLILIIIIYRLGCKVSQK